MANGRLRIELRDRPVELGSRDARTAAPRTVI
jgi:hypothetical protein